MKRWLVLITLSLAMFIIVIDTTIMNVSISALVADLDTTVSGVQSAISIYALVMASFIMIGGKLADVVGKRRVFVVGLLIYGVGTTTAALSQSLGMLIVGWSLLEGLGAALMLPNTQTILRSAYDGDDLAFSYGMIGAVSAVGAAVGPIVGGFLTTFYTWRLAFLLEVAIVLVVLALVRRLPKDELAAERPDIDVGGAALNVVGLSAIVLGVLLIQTYGLVTARQPLVVGGVAIAPFGLSIVPFLMGCGALVMGYLWRRERRMEAAGEPGLFKPSLFGIAGLAPGFSVRCLQMAMTAGFLFVYPLFLQLTFSYTAMETGVALVPLSLALLVFALIGARLSSRLAAQRVIQVGLVASIAGLAWIAAAIEPGVTPAQLAGTGLLGVGLGLVTSQIINLVLSTVDTRDTAEAAGLNGTFEQLGNSIGVALAGTIMLASLINGLTVAVTESDSISDAAKPAVIESIETSIEVVSDEDLSADLAASGATDEQIAAGLELYRAERTGAFHAAVAFLGLLGVVALVATRGLPRRKLVAV